MADMPPSFREVQHFKQLWIWAIVLGVAAIFWYALITQIFYGRPFGANPMPNWLLLILWLLIGIGLPLLIYASHLTTEVREDGLYLRFFPFHLSFRPIAFEHIKRCRVRTYKPIREYGGWGIRYKPGGGRAFNVYGNRGVQLTMINGKKILIGSQRPEELLAAIQQKKSG